jgi:hypothetical protein
MLYLVLLIAALVLFILASVGVAHPRVNLMSAGLACLAGAMLASKYGI